MALHIIKLAVGATDIPDLVRWHKRQESARREMGLDAVPVCNTRMVPKRRDEVLDGGSLFWVIKGSLCVRQAITDIRQFDDVAGGRCELVLSPHHIRVAPRQRRAFQGWRYMAPADAPPDLVAGQGGEDLPEDLARQLSEIGAW
jgi:hypothetical protein